MLLAFLLKLKEQHFNTRQKAHGNQARSHKFARTRAGLYFSRTRFCCCFFVTGPCHKPKDRGWIILRLVRIHSEWSEFPSRFIVNQPVCVCTGILIGQKKWIKKKTTKVQDSINDSINDSDITAIRISPLQPVWSKINYSLYRSRWCWGWFWVRAVVLITVRSERQTVAGCKKNCN